MRVVAWLLLAPFAAAALPAQTFNGRTATEWVQDLGAADEETRERAVQSLVTMRERAVRATLRALGDERPLVRANAALALGRLGAIAAEARDQLVAMEADADAAVAHAAAVAALRVRVDAAALPELRAAAGSGDWDLQLAAAEVLQQLGRAAQPATPELVALLTSSDQALDRTRVVEVRRARAMIDEVAKSEALSLRDRDALLSVGLTVLAGLDAKPHRERFAVHAQSDEAEVRQSALAGLAALGDPEAKAELGVDASEAAIPAALRERLEQVRVRLVQVRHATLRSVLALLTRELGVPVVLSPDADQALLDQRFDGMYFELLGFRPSAGAVLGVVGNDFFFGADLEVRCRDDRIELVPKPSADRRRRR